MSSSARSRYSRELFPETAVRPKLFVPRAGDDPVPQAAAPVVIPPNARMREFFKAALLPWLIAECRASETISAYWTAIGHWEHRTADPVLLSVTNQSIADWKAAMEKAGYSAGTINKYWRCLRAIFRRAGQSTDRNPLGLELIGRVPYMPPAKGPTREEGRFVGDDECTELYRACDCVKQARCGGSDRRALFRLAIVLDRTYGPRTRDLFALERSKVFRSAWHPDGLPLEAKLGWFEFTTKKTGVRLVLPLSTAARTHFDALGIGDREVGPVFPPSFVKSNNVLYRGWDRIKTIALERLAKADASKERRLPAEGARPKDLRLTANTLWKGLHPTMNLGGFVLGHRSKDVNEEHYTDRAQAVVRRLFLPPDATDLDRHFAWKELPIFLAQPKRERTLFD